MSAQTADVPQAQGTHTLGRAALAVVVAAVPAVIVCVVIGVLARAAGASSDFQALRAGPLTFLIVVGTVAGAIGWVVIRRVASHPAGVLRVLVPVVLLLSLVPDVLVGISGALPGSSWGGVIALMVMHLVVTVFAVVSFERFLPVFRARS